jgi:hypothetical protein
MRSKLRALWRYRPRVLTLVVLSVIGTLLVLTNLSDEYAFRRGSVAAANAADLTATIANLRFDVREPDTEFSPMPYPVGALSNGWPLLWNQYLLLMHGYGAVVLGWRFSAWRLAANVVMWLVLLAVPGAAFEWALRRYRPRMRFSLRTMLAAVGLVAMLLGWFVWARERANKEDALIAMLMEENGEAWLERWGPKWLDLVGADRYRRHIVAARVRAMPVEDEESDNRAAIGLLGRLSELRDLQYLLLNVDHLTSEIAAALKDFPQLRMLSIESRFVQSGAMAELARALSDMPQLRVLSISPRVSIYDDELYSQQDDESQIGHDCLAAIGKASKVEHLHLCGLTIRSESLTLLESLKNLKSLSLALVRRIQDESQASPLFSRLCELPQLESLELASDITDDDLPYLVRAPRLKLLRLSQPEVTGAGFKQLAHLEGLEELSCHGDVVSAACFESLVALKHLKRLHADFEYKQPDGSKGTFELIPHVGPDELERSQRALQVLRQTHPGIVIDGNLYENSWRQRPLLPAGCDTVERRQSSWSRQVVQQWKAGGCPP